MGKRGVDNIPNRRNVTPFPKRLVTDLVVTLSRNLFQNNTRLDRNIRNLPKRPTKTYKTTLNPRGFEIKLRGFASVALLLYRATLL
jgi:hypothetical protein